MELSAIVKKYDLPLTRSERTLVAQLPTGTSTVSEDRYEQQMKALAAARDVIAQLPDKHTLERQRTMEKAGMLKERLKMLRQVTPFMSRSALKSLNAEMRQIAAQLASLGGESGGASGVPIAATDTTVADATKPGCEAEAAPHSAQTNETERGNDVTLQEHHASSGSAVPVAGVKSGESTAEDRQLKETVEELKNLYKAVLAAMKRTQRFGRGKGHPLTPHLRVYTVMPDSANSVAINV